MVTNVYLVDCGILLEPDDREFESYNMVYDKKWGYCDCGDGQYYWRRTLKELQTLLTKQILNGPDMGYAVVSHAVIDDEIYERCVDEDPDGKTLDIPVEGETYTVDDVLWSIAIINGQVVENFIK